MKTPLLIGAVTFVALAALGDVGVKLIGARQQIGAMANAFQANGPAAAAAPPGPVVQERAAGAAAGGAQTGPVRVAGHVMPTDPEAAAVEPAALPGSGLDPEVAIHAVAEQDSGLADLLNNPDPAVGAAIRDFVTSIERPGTH